MKKIFLLSILSILIFVGFAKKPPKNTKAKPISSWVEPPKPKIIYGKWAWFETDCCGIRHGISNPQNTSDEIELEIKSDNTFMEVHTKKNTLPRAGNVILFKENNVDMIQFNDERSAQYFLSNNNDTLIISWKHLELQTEKYIRKK